MYERILFVCTGNTCRSPMAEGLFRKLATEAGLNTEARSAGVSAWDGSPISKHSANILRSRGFAGSLTSSALSGETIAWADLILTMTTGHKQTILRRYPESADKVYTLKEFAEDDPSVTETVAEQQRFHSELQIKQALGQTITDDELRRAKQLGLGMPDFDIADPFGGDQEIYEQCADEIESYVVRLIRKLAQS